MVCLLPGETKVSKAENSETASRHGADDSGTEKLMVAPPQGTRLWAEDGAWWDSRWGRQEDQGIPAGWEEDEEVEGGGAC